MRWKLHWTCCRSARHVPFELLPIYIYDLYSRTGYSFISYSLLPPVGLPSQTRPDGKEFACSMETWAHPESGRSPLFQPTCLKSHGLWAWQVTGHGLVKSQTRMKHHFFHSLWPQNVSSTFSPIPVITMQKALNSLLILSHYADSGQPSYLT